MAATAGGVAPVTIKRYGDWRLYDTDAARYVTLGDIAERVRDGDNLRAVDAATGDDITRDVLVQIIIEEG